jgi:glutaminase-like protein
VERKLSVEPAGILRATRSEIAIDPANCERSPDEPLPERERTIEAEHAAIADFAAARAPAMLGAEPESRGNVVRLRAARGAARSSRREEKRADARELTEVIRAFGIEARAAARTPFGLRIVEESPAKIAEALAARELRPRVKGVLLEALGRHSYESVADLLERYLEGPADARSFPILQALFEKRGATRAESDQMIMLTRNYGLRMVMLPTGKVGMWNTGDPPSSTGRAIRRALADHGDQLAPRVREYLELQTGARKRAPIAYRSARESSCAEVASVVEQLSASRVVSARPQHVSDVVSLSGRLAEVAEVKEIFDRMKSDPRIPWAYIKDGCYARAEVVARAIAAAGIRCVKLFAFDGRTYERRFGSLWSSNEIMDASWWYHMAPIAFARDPETGREQAWVLDPAIADEPLEIEAWIERIADNPVKFDVTPLSQYQPIEFTGVTPPGHDTLARAEATLIDNRMSLLIFGEHQRRSRDVRCVRAIEEDRNGTWVTFTGPAGYYRIGDDRADVKAALERALATGEKADVEWDPSNHEITRAECPAR